MVVRNFALVLAAALILSQVPALLKDRSGPEDLSEPATTASVVAAAGAPARAVVLPADSNGHFRASFRLNGKMIDGLVDTGASFVALNETTARKLGYGGNSLDFRYAVSTANGPSEAAHVVLAAVEIGGVRVRDVDAYVLKDRSLATTLIGVSFLRRLKSYAVDQKGMTLVE